MKFREAASIHVRNLDNDSTIKPRTRDYWRECLNALVKSWRGLGAIEVRKITKAKCKEWASEFAKKASPTRFVNKDDVVIRDFESWDFD